MGFAAVLALIAFDHKPLPAVTVAEEGGAHYAPARSVGKRFGLKFEEHPEAGLAFLGPIPLDRSHRAPGTGWMVRLTQLTSAGAKVASKDGLVSVSLGGKAAIYVAGDKRVLIDLSTQELKAFEGSAIAMHSRISTGRGRNATPRGSFRAGVKDPYHESSTYGGSAMPWAVHVYKAVYVHGSSSVPDVPASHGCVRLPMDAAEWFYRWVSPGTPITIKGHWKPKPAKSA